ncbi:pyranose dehydrogenase, partial [Lyophyllum atratum]
MGMSPLRAIACVFLVAAQTSLAAIYDHFESLPALKFDFVVIGGGTAGNVIANRLTEDPKINVLVLESGPSNEGVLRSIVPGLATSPGGAAYDWNFTTTPQAALGGRSVGYPRGHILGGSSSINGMFYTRGSSSDFNRFATVTGDSGWSWNQIQPYIRKNERWTPPVDHHNTTNQFDPSVHGFNGVNAVSLSGFPQPTDSRVIQAGVELNQEFPFNKDMNSGNPLGLGWLQTTIGNGQRSSSATSYLGPQFINRRNLHVLVNTRVTRILKTNSVGSTPVIRTVEFTDEKNLGPRRVITASKELVLSAGTIGTPHILLNSGIGDATELSAMGITPIINLPSVGKNLSDQPGLSMACMKFVPFSIENNATLKAELIKQWQETKTGPLATSFASHIAWSRMPSNSSIFKSFEDPSSGPSTPHHELFIGVRLYHAAGPGHFLGITAVVVTPVSRGSVSLRSANPLDPPLINPAYLTSEFDLFAMREAVQSANRFVSAPAWDNYVIGPAGDLANATDSNQSLEEYIRKNAVGASHPTGTAAMSAEGAREGVVNPDLRVKGVSGLRIVDASVMPFVTAGHTMAPVYIIAERAADLMKAHW